MNDFAFPFWAVYQLLENRLALAEAVSFPELTRLAHQRSRLLHALERNLKRLVEKAPLVTLVILTSNLGAESYQQGCFGYAAPAEETQTRDAARAHFVRAVQGYVRPELFNRLDRLVPFAPLSADVIRGIAERHLRRDDWTAATACAIAA